MRVEGDDFVENAARAVEMSDSIFNFVGGSFC